MGLPISQIYIYLKRIKCSLSVYVFEWKIVDKGVSLNKASFVIELLIILDYSKGLTDARVLNALISLDHTENLQ